LEYPCLMDPRKRPRFEHEKLKVFWKAKDAVDEVLAISARSFAGMADQRNQAVRSARSILLNIAEAASEYPPKEKARLYRIARRSAGETAANLLGLPLAPRDVEHARRAEALLGEVTAMLTTMIRNFERGSPCPPSPSEPPPPAPSSPARSEQ
jgi:four helix bundle protein